MEVMRGSREDPVGFRANELAIQFLNGLVLSADFARRGDGLKALSGALGGTIEAAFGLSGLTPAEFRRFITENVSAYCDHIDPPEEGESDD